MSADYSTNTETDAGISAGFDAYPGDIDRPSRADIEAEAEWLRRHVNEPTPVGMEDRIVAACTQELERRRAKQKAWEADHTCQGCGFVPAETVCAHGKCICEGCWPDKCWACQADSETVGAP